MFAEINKSLANKLKILAVANDSSVTMFMEKAIKYYIKNHAEKDQINEIYKNRE